MTKSRLSQGLKNAQTRLLNQNSKKILNNVLLLYVVLFAVITDLLYLVSIGAHSNVIVFILVAYITSMFSKNMTVILIVALAITNVYHLGRGIVVKEGFEEGEGEGEDEDEDKDKDVDTDTDKDKETKSKKGEQLPEEYKDALKQLSDPETLKTIEGLKSLEPLIGRMEGVIKMFK